MVKFRWILISAEYSLFPSMDNTSTSAYFSPVDVIRSHTSLVPGKATKGNKEKGEQVLRLDTAHKEASRMEQQDHKQYITVTKKRTKFCLTQ